MGKHKLRVWLIIAALCVAFGGCVEAKVLSFAKYNKTTDSFSLLEVYANIATKDEEELKHIETLWRCKENLIINPMSVRLQFYTPTIFERRGKHSYRRLALGAVKKEEPETLTASADLASIDVIPGEFFLNEYKNLCYYQQILIPGKTVDAVMRDMLPAIADELADFADRQIKKSGPEGSQKLSWNDLRELISQSLEEKETKPTGEIVQGPLEMASLRLLMNAGTDKTVQFTRKANAFTLVVPLSRRDTDEAIATTNLAKTIVAERLKAGKTVDKHVVRLLEATELNRGERDGLSVTIHVERLMRIVNADKNVHVSKWDHVGGAFYVARLMELLTDDETVMPSPDKDRKMTYGTTIESLKTRGIDASPTDQFPIIQKRFLSAGTTP